MISCLAVDHIVYLTATLLLGYSLWTAIDCQLSLLSTSLSCVSSLDCFLYKIILCCDSAYTSGTVYIISLISRQETDV